MGEQLTVFGECTATPWTISSKQGLSIVTYGGQALYWEWKCEEKGIGPEDFLLFVRTIFPNGGYFLSSHCNHSVLWSPMEDDAFAIGIRKLKVHDMWIVAVLSVAENYPGSSQCPDSHMSMLSCKFLAEEFMRGTNPGDVYNCEEYLCKESSNWWKYLQKVEKLVNWKLPEVKIYLQKFGHQNHEKSNCPDKYFEKKQTMRFDRRQDRTHASNDWHQRTSSVDYHTRRDVPDSRSRSPAKFVVLQPKRDFAEPQLRVSSHTTAPSAAIPALSNTGKLRCNRCNIDFQQTYELMKHYNSEEHQAAVAREYPI